MAQDTARERLRVESKGSNRRKEKRQAPCQVYRTLTASLTDVAEVQARCKVWFASSRRVRRTALRRVFWARCKHGKCAIAVCAAGRRHGRAVGHAYAAGSLAWRVGREAPAGGVVGSEGVAVRTQSGCGVADAELEPFGAAIFGVAAEGITASETVTT